VLLKHAIKGRSSNIWLGDKAALSEGSILWADNQGLNRWKLRVAGAVVMGVRRSCLRWQRTHKSTALITRLTLKRAINHTSSMRWPHKTANFEECTPPDSWDSFVSQSFGFLDSTSGFRTSEYTLLASSLRCPFAAVTKIPNWQNSRQIRSDRLSIGQKCVIFDTQFLINWTTNSLTVNAS